jgi:hypothetical protein
MKEQMKADFEAWAESRCYYLDRDAEDKYIKCTTALAWEIWREAQPKVNRNKDKLDNPLADEAIRVLQAAGYETLGCGIADEFFSLKDKISELEAALSAVPNHIPDVGKMVQPAPTMSQFANKAGYVNALRPSFVLPKEQPAQEPVKRLQAAIEGELNGLAVDESTASKILAYVQEPVKQESTPVEIGTVEQWATPANLPAYVTVKWNGKPPSHGTKVYTKPVKQESESDYMPIHRDEWSKNVSIMWQCVRKHDCSIPDYELDLMRHILLTAVPPVVRKNDEPVKEVTE